MSASSSSSSKQLALRNRGRHSIARTCSSIESYSRVALSQDIDRHKRLKVFVNQLDLAQELDTPALEGYV